MPRTCTICSHPSRKAIDNGLADGVPFRTIAQRFIASPDAMRRHEAANHHVKAMAKAEHADVVAGADLIERVEKLIRLAEGVMARCIAERDNKTTFVGIRESARLIDLLGRLKGELDSSTTVNVQVNFLVSSEYMAIKAVLDRYPEVRYEVSAALYELGKQAALPAPGQ